MSDSCILIVDDDPEARRRVRLALGAQGFEVDDAASGEEAVRKLRREPAAVVLLDLKMPGIGGIAACREIRAMSEVPIIAVSGRKAPSDRTEAFEAGADQFVLKPCGTAELVARIRALRRRAEAARTATLILGDVEVNFETHEVNRKDGVCHLTAKEFSLLRCLAAHAGKVVAHRRILQTVWGPDYGDELQYLRVFVNQLRRKIEPNPARPAYILTDLSAGYRLFVPQQHRTLAASGR